MKIELSQIRYPPMHPEEVVDVMQIKEEKIIFLYDSSGDAKVFIARDNVLQYISCLGELNELGDYRNVLREKEISDDIVLEVINNYKSLEGAKRELKGAEVDFKKSMKTLFDKIKSK